MDEWSSLLILIALAFAGGAKGLINPNCTGEEFARKDGSERLSWFRFCNGEHCKDDSDEILPSLPLKSNDTGIPCRQFSRIYPLPKNRRSKTKDTVCTDEEFACEDGSGCLTPSEFCDGWYPNCKDGSDEISVNSLRPGTPCRRDKFICLLPPSQLHKEGVFCNKSATCSDNELSCADKAGCLSTSWFCDVMQDCRYASEEISRLLPLNSTEAGNACRQSDDICLPPKNQKSKRNVPCKRNFVCTDEEFACEDGLRCILSSRFCDGEKNCRDGSDEISVSSSGPGKPCRRDKFICLLPPRQVHKEGVFCVKNVTCSEDEFPCADKAGCLPITWFCDGRQDCRDGSDDKRILKKPTDGFQICDGRHHFSSDPLKCEVSTNITCPEEPFCLSDPADILDGNCFRCLQYPYIVIPTAKLCNGFIDCPDLSDECMCKTKNRPGICERVSWEFGSDGDPLITFRCQRENGEEIIKNKDVCNVKVDCVDRIDEKYCSKGVYDAVGETIAQSKNYTCRSDENIRKKASRCDGVPECKYDVFSEECDCSDPPAFCNFIEITRKWSFLSCNTTNDWNKVHRPGFVYGTSICDRVSHCSDQKDELNCSNRTHFYCAQGLPMFIPKQQKCDRVVDCADESDESSCNFKCPGNQTVHYIGYEQVCDGVQNCAGGNDECQPNCINSTFSDNSKMIKDTPVLVCLLFMGAFALSGNSLVILATFRDFFFAKKKPFVRDNKKSQRQRILINRVLILNLALSDLLVGIYMFAICIKSLVTDGDYCLVDRDWRGGATCSTLGAILVIGSQQSVFTMILVTASRLMGIRRILSDMPLKRLLTTVGLAWIVSITLAVIPLLPSLEDTFTTSIWYEENALFATIQQNDIKDITMWLLTMANSTEEHGHVGSWVTMENLIGKLSSNLTVGRRYGFYSSHTVCIPDLFPDQVNNASWWYSLLLILINFLAFVFILVGCFLIYRHATRKNPIRSAEQQTEISLRMQKKLTVIVATDFLCWIPVCIMAFFQLSGVNIPQDWRLVVGLIIIPINSAVNPVIYSNLPEMIWAKTERFRVWVYSCFEKNCIRERPLPPAADPEVIQEETAV